MITERERTKEETRKTEKERRNAEDQARQKEKNKEFLMWLLLLMEPRLP
jgi:hypothetical protein